MAASSRFDLTLFIKAVDEATGPMRAVNAALDKLTAPFKQVGSVFADIGKQAGLPALWGGLGKVGGAAKDVAVEAAKLAAKLLAIGGAAAYGTYQIIKGSVDAGSALALASARAGMTADTYAQLRFATGQLGVSQEEYAEGIDRFNKSLGGLRTGTGPLLAFLKEASPALAVQLRRTKNTSEAIDLMTGAFSKLKDTSKIAALSGAAFGKGNLQMGFALQKGRKEIEALEKRYGTIAGPQDEFAEQSRLTAKSLDEASVAFESLRNAAITPLMPAVRMLSDAFVEFVTENRDGIVTWAKETGKAIEDWIKRGGLKDLKRDVLDMAKAVQDAVEKIGGLKGVAIGAAFILGAPLLGAISNLTVALVQVTPLLVRTGASIGSMVVMPVIGFLADFVVGLAAGYGGLEALGLAAAANPLGPFIIAAAAVAAAGYEAYTHWDDLKLIFSEFWDGVVEKFRAGWAKIKPYVDLLKKAAATIPGMSPFTDALSVGEQGADILLGGGPAPAVRTVNPAYIPPQYIGPGLAFADSGTGKTGDMVLRVDFNGAPVGMRVSTDAPSGGPKVETNVNRGPTVDH